MIYREKETINLIKEHFDNLDLINRIRFEFSFQKISGFKHPIIKDPQNYTYTKRSISNKIIYFYCSMLIIKDEFIYHFDSSESTQQIIVLPLSYLPWLETVFVQNQQKLLEH